MGLKMQDGSEGLPGMAEVKSLSSLVSHVLCRVITVTILKRSVTLTCGTAWCSWLLWGIKGKAAEFFGLAQGRE